MSKNNKGIPIVLSAPSGGGKTTIATELLKRNSNLVRSISCTTRRPRGQEKDGKDYFFVDVEPFKKKISEGGFLEWALVHDHYYGTPLQFLKSQLDDGKDVLLVIDPQGAVSVRKIYPDGLFIFVVPPTWDELTNRLKARGTDETKEIDVRLANAKKELGYLNHYSYLVVNDNLEKATEKVQAIITAEHLNVTRIDRNSIQILN